VRAMPEGTITRELAANLMARVYALVRACPAGRVTTYSWLGKAVGHPRGARMIGWIMNDTHAGIPAQRVISSKGELTGGWAFGGREAMHALLEAEGINFTEDGLVDLKRYGWDPSRDLSAAERDQIFAGATDLAPVPSERLMHLLAHDPASPFRATPATE
jgi:methylated-DNA-protein-cysteine methyltransferase-like protein